MTLYIKLLKISQQSKNWALYGKLMPLLFVLSGVSLYGIGYSKITSFLYASWALFLITSVIWWFWVIKTISEMSRMFKTILKLVVDLQGDIKTVHKEIKNLNPNDNE